MGAQTTEVLTVSRARAVSIPVMSKRKMSLLSSFENISPQVISRVGREIQDLQRE